MTTPIYKKPRLLNYNLYHLITVRQESWNRCDILRYTVKTAHAVTSIKQSPVLKGHLCLVFSKKIYK